MQRICFMKSRKTIISPKKRNALYTFSRNLYRQIQYINAVDPAWVQSFPSIREEGNCNRCPDTTPQHRFFCKSQLISPELVIVCIGTELVMGDCLGPLVGYQLSRHTLANACVYGTLKDPIHALNLKQKMESIKKKHPASHIIAIDASFGSRRHLGTVFIQPGPLYPGLGVSKDLPPVGDISITGIVCTQGPDSNERLKDTPLSLLLPQAEIITEGIIRTLSRFDKRRLHPDHIFQGASLQNRILQIHR